MKYITSIKTFVYSVLDKSSILICNSLMSSCIPLVCNHTLNNIRLYVNMDETIIAFVSSNLIVFSDLINNFTIFN
jgi:hypothetical protein